MDSWGLVCGCGSQGIGLAMQASNAGLASALSVHRRFSARWRKGIVSSTFCSISRMLFGKQVISSTIYPSPLSVGEGDGDPLQQWVVLPESQQARIYDFSRLHGYPLTMFIGMPPGWPSRLTS